MRHQASPCGEAQRQVDNLLEDDDLIAKRGCKPSEHDQVEMRSFAKLPSATHMGAAAETPGRSSRLARRARLRLGSSRGTDFQGLACSSASKPAVLVLCVAPLNVDEQARQKDFNRETAFVATPGCVRVSRENPWTQRRTCVPVRGETGEIWWCHGEMGRFEGAFWLLATFGPPSTYNNRLPSSTHCE